MRDIFFRGKRKSTGKWVHGDYVKVGTDCFIVTHRPDAKSGTDEPLCVPVIPATVGQYVGMVCMDGTMIFEGDILRIVPDGGEESGDADVCAVKWQDAFLTWALTGIDDAVLCEFSPEHITVIGNIHDNPDLL